MKPIPEFVFAVLCAGLALAPARAEPPNHRGDAPSKTYGIEVFGGTWCFEDGVKSHYEVVAPNRLRLTRLTPARVAIFGRVLEFHARRIGPNRFEWGLDDGGDVFVLRIDGEDAFSFVEWYDPTNDTVRHAISGQEARRCGNETSQTSPTRDRAAPRYSS
jgi:hypothetical protein